MDTETRKCEVCGEVKPLSAFSKSYKHRCKDCVAAQTKQKRLNKAIGNALDVMENTIEEINKGQEKALWEQRRYEIARCFMAAILANPNRKSWTAKHSVQAHAAVNAADALIAELKKGGQQ